jgi:hypothetical protein
MYKTKSRFVIVVRCVHVSSQPLLRQIWWSLQRVGKTTEALLESATAALAQRNYRCGANQCCHAMAFKLGRAAGRDLLRPRPYTPPPRCARRRLLIGISVACTPPHASPSPPAVRLEPPALGELADAGRVGRAALAARPEHGPTCAVGHPARGVMPPPVPASPY